MGMALHDFKLVLRERAERPKGTGGRIPTHPP
jgi:hypothetical protein